MDPKMATTKKLGRVKAPKIIHCPSHHNWADDNTTKWGVRKPEDNDALARKLACCIFHLGAHAKLYTTRSRNLVGETIYWLHLDAPRSVWNEVWRAAGGFGGTQGILKETELDAAAKEAAA